MGYGMVDGSDACRAHLIVYSSARRMMVFGHFHFYFALVEIRSVRPFFGGTVTPSAVPPGRPKVKMV
jgi:hypothetical protein